uniref:Si:dkey-243k1.3 n=2 Tax=Echeneis naucrates TaxID=173247 RepID=A0A665VA24_ECHNA
MQTWETLCALVLFLVCVHADVVEHFEDVPDCLKYFYKDKVPEWGASTPGAARLCQRFVNRYHFATLYDTHHRIAVYSAYHFQPSNGGGRESRWFVEPQVGWLVGCLHFACAPADGVTVDIFSIQCMSYEDYTHSGFDRGHLNPNGHHAVPSRNATFTLTNVVPQNPKLNQNSWRIHESQLTDLFRSKCSKAYVLVGAIPSVDNWIVKNNVKRVNIPDYLWNAYCCVDNNGRPLQSGAAAARNTEDNWVEKLTVDELGEFLQQFSNQPVGELFYNNCRA